MSPDTKVRAFMAVAVAEAVSWVGLLTGMYFKYLTDAGELGVKVFGPIHGVIFVGYVLLTLVVARELRWPARTTATALVCSVPPFATLVFELWALRAGRLAVRPTGTARPGDAQPTTVGDDAPVLERRPG